LDSVEHAVFACDAWYHWRREACGYLGVDQLTPENLINLMLKSKESWRRIEELLTRIMKRGKEEAKRIQYGQ
jgi:hypothetical protein